MPVALAGDVKNFENSCPGHPPTGYVATCTFATIWTAHATCVAGSIVVWGTRLAGRLPREMHHSESDDYGEDAYGDAGPQRLVALAIRMLFDILVVML